MEFVGVKLLRFSMPNAQNLGVFSKHVKAESLHTKGAKTWKYIRLKNTLDFCNIKMVQVVCLNTCTMKKHARNITMSGNTLFDKSYIYYVFTMY